MTDDREDRVSRRRYMREQMARQEAEALLERKSRELFLANQKLSAHSETLEKAVQDRTAELEIALKASEQSSTARSRFIATMSHEIRTPLGGMLGMIDLLGMDETDPTKKELLDYAKTAGRGLSRIVSDVLDFSKMEAGVFVFEEENVDVRALIESVRFLADSNQATTNRPISIKISKSVPKLFLGDATRIRQVISNLISNALRYSTDGPIIVRAETAAHPKGALLRVEVEDFGVGIAEAELVNLFKDFSQIANPLTAAAQGAGLGLAICSRILDGCGGKVGVESVLGEGSIFWFELPVKVVAAHGGLDADDAPMIDGLSTQSLVGKRVLIAEDNIINQKMLLTYVNRLGLTAELAENGRIALETFAPDKFDIVLMDVAMPEMDGLEATRRIREKWGGTELPPILILTAHVMDAIEVEANLVGVKTILSKPIPFNDLKLALEKALSEQSVDKNARPQFFGDALPAVPEQTLAQLMAPDVLKELQDVFSTDDLNGLVRKYVSDSNERVSVIKKALGSGDAEVVSNQAHSLKGSSLALGFKHMADTAYFVENSDVGHDRGVVADRVDEMRSMLARISDLIV